MEFNSIQINFTKAHHWQQQAIKVTITATYGRHGEQQKLIATAIHPEHHGNDIELTDHKIVKDIVNELGRMLPSLSYK